MEKKIMRKKTLIGVSLFLVLFSTLLALASIYDLQVSQRLTSGNLSEGFYYADTFFGVSLEIMGSFPVWLLIAIGGAIIFLNTKRDTLFSLDKKNANAKLVNVLNYVLGFLGLVAAVAAVYLLFADSFKYILKYVGAYQWKKDPKYIGAMLIMTAIFAPILITWVGKRSDEQLKDLKTLVWIILVALVTRIFIEGIKVPVGRMRFRAMNAIGDFSYYTPWYIMNGARDLTDLGFEASWLEQQCHIFEWEIEDACRSFPSGHTFAAGMSYVLICLPDIVKKYDNIVGRLVCWIVPLLYTGIVAVSRIMVGAHYFSDVLFGGTIVFLGVIIGREIFICKGSHIKCFMKDKVTK